MSKFTKHQLLLLLIVFVLVLALLPTPCSALSYRNSPCDVGDGFFFYLPDRGGDWEIYHETKTQRTTCYNVGSQDAFDVAWRPDFDFDETWVYIKTDIYEPKHVEPPNTKRTERLAYFIFNKETRKMSGPLTANEFFENPATAGKNFDWKHGDYKDTRGFKWIMLAMFLTACSPIFLAILLGILGKWAYELYVYRRKKQPTM
ncbi:MAG: hypothetical protein FWD31_13770 [Planctomycetaceae bacterium]|nr:hypothetical protein [Planctomycetaceae bacterium]